MKRYPSPALRLGSAALVLTTMTMFFAAGCAGSSPNVGMGETKVAGMPPEAPPQNLSEAEAQFASAEQHVFGALGVGIDKREMQGPFAQPPGQLAQQQPTSPSATATVTSGSTPPPPPADSYQPHKEGEARAAAGAAPAPAGDMAPVSSNPCETACKALASMDRAATHICSLAGNEDSRCTNARERVRAATERVRQSCSDCNG